jgi:Fibronectin type III domain
MNVAKHAARNKPELAAKQGDVSTVVVLVAKVLGLPAVYWYDYSLDQKTWTTVPQTTKASTVVSGLTPGQTYYFRFHAFSRKGLTDYSQVVSLLVR